MDDPALLKRFVESYQRIALPEEQARQIADIVRGANDRALEAAVAMPFDADACGFLLALEAEDPADVR